MTDTDDLGPLMRAVEGYYNAESHGFGDQVFERVRLAVRRKAEQYGVWQREVSLNAHGWGDLTRTEAARRVYFEEEQP